MFDKKYYDNKKESLQKRLTKKKDGLINDMLSSMRTFLEDQGTIQEEYAEIVKREKEESEKSSEKSSKKEQTGKKAPKK